MRRTLERFIVMALILWITVEVQGALWGASSYSTLEAKTAEYDALSLEVSELVAKRTDLARRADSLNKRSLDLDYLQERVRIVLGFVHNNEIIIPRDQVETVLKSRAQ